MSFEKLGLKAEIVRAVTEAGYKKPTPIQKQAIPAALEGQDVMGGAQTGTGKTAAFTLPLLQHLSNTPINTKGRRKVRALIVTPTRELADQVYASVRKYGKYLNLKSTVVFGGVNIYRQIEKLRNGVDIVIATPGRLLDHEERKTIDLSNIEILVLDEADRILDMGFLPDLRRIIACLPKKRQNLLFFATFCDGVKKLAHSLLKSPVLIEVAARNTAAKSVEQIIHPIDRSRKRELLSFLIGSENWQQVLVFTRTKHKANHLVEQLELDGLRATAIHGNKSQAARTRALNQFKQGKVQVLVATDVASRGLDINNLSHVINFELPESPEDYVHRIGRTGRAGSDGTAISLVCVDETRLLNDIEKLLKFKIKQVVIPGYEPDLSIRPEPIRQKYTRKPGGKKRSGGGRANRGRSSKPRRGRR